MDAGYSCHSTLSPHWSELRQRPNWPTPRLDHIHVEAKVSEGPFGARAPTSSTSITSWSGYMERGHKAALGLYLGQFYHFVGFRRLVNWAHSSKKLYKYILDLKVGLILFSPKILPCFGET
ncbi:hypothetical protein BRARA_I01955 [Brassica rapa]|uniref:Uncharacterized protein n=1 Tax=Brassica campestris TaxID=3711 RepID=A0A397XV26_BRACM|nr:hypothetical protein BRARA_I01955 [Brassica rapa]